MTINEVDRLIARVTVAETEYQKYFNKKLKEYDVDSPADLADDKKDDFFEEVDDGWDAEEESDGKKSSQKLGGLGKFSSFADAVMDEMHEVQETIRLFMSMAEFRRSGRGSENIVLDGNQRKSLSKIIVNARNLEDGIVDLLGSARDLKQRAEKMDPFMRYE